MKPTYLVAVINSDALQEAVKPLMSKGQFGARDLHKHLWKLPIPEFDPNGGVAFAVIAARWSNGGKQCRLRSWRKSGNGEATR